jgi:DNA-binding response OmpR family regulator
MQAMSRVLVVEDQLELQRELVQALARAGLAADACASTAHAGACLEAVSYGALILDRGLPDGDGLVWLKRQRERRPGTRALPPCLILTARDALRDRIDGLDGGADDYLTKPFELEELLARVRALLRRPAAVASSQRQWAGVSIQPELAQMSSAQGSVTLSASELQVMLSLVCAQGMVVRRKTLEDAAWGLSEAVTPNALDVVLHRLRRKLHSLGSPLQIGNTKGVGYALQSEPLA